MSSRKRGSTVTFPAEVHVNGQTFALFESLMIPEPLLSALMVNVHEYPGSPAVCLSNLNLLKFSIIYSLISEARYHHGL